MLFAVLVLAMATAMVAVLGNEQASGVALRTTGSHVSQDGAVQTAGKAVRPSRSAGILTLDWGDIDSTPDAHLGNYVLLQPWEHDRIAGLREANPDIKVLMYKDVAATVERACVRDEHGECTRDNDILPTGVGYHWSQANHPEWFLRDRDGQALEWSDWAGLFPMDVGSSTYQEVWTSNVLSELSSHDWDGVMMDDVLTTLSHTVVDDRVSTTIPDDAAMYAATEGFLAFAGPAIKDAGFEVIANVAFQWDDYRAVLEDWTRYVTGWENEYFVKWGLDKRARFSGADWNWKMLLSAWCAERDVPLLAVTYSAQDDFVAQTYHRATWLLTWNGRTGSSIFVPLEDFTDHWLPRATVDIGRPDGPRRVVSRGSVHRRDYTAGVVLVNPSDVRRTVRLGARYRNANGRLVSRVRLAPSSAAILRRR